MATDFPTSKQTFTNPTGSDKLNSPDHATQHATENDTIEALQDKVGIDSSGDTNSHDYKISALETGKQDAITPANFAGSDCTGSSPAKNRTLDISSGTPFQVFVDGVFLHPTLDYSVAGTVITFLNYINNAQKITVYKT